MNDDNWPDDDLEPDVGAPVRDDAEDLFPLALAPRRRWSAFVGLDLFPKAALFLPLVSAAVAERSNSWPTMWVCAVMAFVISLAFATGSARLWAGVAVAVLSAAAIQIPGRPLIGAVLVGVAMVASLAFAWLSERR